MERPILQNSSRIIKMMIVATPNGRRITESQKIETCFEVLANTFQVTAHSGIVSESSGRHFGAPDLMNSSFSWTCSLD